MTRLASNIFMTCYCRRSWRHFIKTYQIRYHFQWLNKFIPTIQAAEWDSLFSLCSLVMLNLHTVYVFSLCNDATLWICHLLPGLVVTSPLERYLFVSANTNSWVLAHVIWLSSLILIVHSVMEVCYLLFATSANIISSRGLMLSTYCNTKVTLHLYENITPQH